MRISDFNFDLPEDLIAQHGLAERDRARMLVLNRASGVWRDSNFLEFPCYPEAGDAVVVNNTRVFPARLKGVRETSGGRVELLLLREETTGVWETLARPGRRLKQGDALVFGKGRLRAEVIGEALPDGKRLVSFQHEEDFHSLLDELGETPLPPYIKRTEKRAANDRERYQTIFAEQRGSIAAPTAGLHWTPRVRAELAARDIELIEITLHVGYGTFAPVRVEDLREHEVAAERYEISTEAAWAINRTHEKGKRIFAVGTTTVRALESAADEAGRVAATGGGRETNLTITPGYEFRVIDALLTNFHLPRSSLLFLVAAFGGREKVLAAYRHAVEARYRFYSYGDCMLII